MRRSSPRRLRAPASAPVRLAVFAALAATVAALARPATAGAQDTRLLVVGGLGGAPEFREEFHRSAVRITSAARERFGLPGERVVYLAPNPASDPERISGESTLENVRATLTAFAEEAAADDRILVVLLGHGSWDGERSKFSLPGPDLTAEELAAIVQRFGEQTVAVVNAASASGEFVPALSGSGRIVITATRTGGERNATQFGRFFASALAEEGSDADRDGTLSLLEAFRWARTRVERFYEERNLLATEHPQLDDDGDGEGTGAPDAGDGDGGLAAGFLLGGRAAVADVDDPELRELYRERLRLESDVEELRSRQEAMTPEAYRDSLETLLVELARTNRRIREREGGGG